MKTFSKYILAFSLLFITLCASAQTDVKLLRKGNRQYKKGNFEEAEVQYKKALEARPNNANAQFNIGDALFGQENYDAAYSAFEKVVEMTPDAKLKSNAVYNMGNCLLAQDKYYDAFNVYKVALKLNHENEDALYNLEYCRAHLVKSHVYVYPNTEHGTVEASEKEAFNGQRVNLSSKADEGYALSSYIVVRADNTEVQVEVQGSSFVMPKFDVIVTAEFKQAHKIEVENNIPHGKAMADKQKAVEGQQVVLRSEPENGYMVERYTVYKTGSRNDTLQVNDTVFQMPDYDVTVTAKFRTALRVHVEKCENGTVQVSDSLAIPGQNIGVIVKPSKGFQLGDMYVVSDQDPNMGAPVSDENVFQMPETDVTLHANFVEATDYYKVQADTTIQGGHVLLDQEEATRRETVALRNAPEPGYQFKEYQIHQVGDTAIKVMPMGNFFTMPDFDVEVTAVFEKNEGQDQQQQQQQQQQEQQQDQQDQQDQQQQQNQQDQQQQQQNQQQQSQEMSKDDAQRMLDALENQEKKTMEKVNEQKIRQQPKKRSEKDW